MWYNQDDSLGDWELIRSEEKEAFSRTDYVDTQARARKEYYYKIRSEDASNNLSCFSDSIYYSLLPRLDAGLISPNSLTDTLGVQRTFSWSYGLGIRMEEYCLTIITETNELVIRQVFLPSNYIGGYEYWTIPDTIELDQGSNYQWRIDMGAKYIDGCETAGSESNWATFVVFNY